MIPAIPAKKKNPAWMQARWVTMEPGIYITEENLGVRIEDDF